MNVKIVNETLLDDKSVRLVVKTTKKDLIVVGFILEALEGHCNYTTIDRNEVLLQIDSPPDFILTTKKFIELISKFN